MDICKYYKSPETTPGYISPVFRFKIKKAITPVPVLLETTAGPAIRIPSNAGQVKVRRLPSGHTPVIAPECKQILSVFINLYVFPGVY
jgi:hypothetical protein